MASELPARQLALFGPQPAAPGVVPPPAERPGPATRLAPAVLAFDQHLARIGKTLNTRRAFASDLGILLDWLGPEKPVSAVTVDDLNRFLTWMETGRASACSPKTYARRVTALKVFFGWLAGAGALATDPALAVAQRRAEPPLPLVLADEQVASLLASAAAQQPADPRPGLLLRLLLDTGLKKGELMALDVDDVAPGAEPPSLLVRYDDPRWRQKERRVVFSEHVGPELAAYVRRYQPTGRLFDCTARNLEYVLAARVAEAALPRTTSFETLRWTAATRLWRAGVPADALRARLGLSPITWADTERKLQVLAPGAGPTDVAPWFPEAEPTGG